MIRKIVVLVILVFTQSIGNEAQNMSAAFTVAVTVIAILFIAVIIFVTALIGTICWRKKRQNKVKGINSTHDHSESDYNLESMKRGTNLGEDENMPTQKQYQAPGGVAEEKL